MPKTFREWQVDQVLMFPPTVRDFVPEGHLAHMVRDLVREELDLAEFYARYTENRGQPPYSPALMVALLLYAYSRGIYSSRSIERACEERVDFMALTGRSKPDHDTICAFRKAHREALARLFVQVLELCRDAGLVKLGHVALDGTKVKANASKHKAMSYARMKEREPELAAEVEKWLQSAQQTDEVEDREHGEKRGDEIPPHVRNKIRRLARIRASRARLETEAQARAEQAAAERERRAQEEGRPPRGRPPSGEPEPKAQSNFTDPESRILKTSGGYEQAYNCQIAVDAASQVIVAHDVVAKQNDSEELVGIVDQIEANLGARPQQLSADANYCSEANLEALEQRGVDPYLATGRQKHGEASPTSNETAKRGPRVTAMREKLRAEGHASPYRLRKQSVEPVNGQIKEARGFRRFLHRGLAKVRGEWALVCTAHNLTKLAGARATVP